MITVVASKKTLRPYQSLAIVQMMQGTRLAMEVQRRNAVPQKKAPPPVATPHLLSCNIMTVWTEQGE